jgi:hypothetical protein
MPYDLRKFKGGYKVCKKNGSKCFSKNPMPKARAERQIAAMHINTNESALNEFNILSSDNSEESGYSKENYVGPFMFKRVFTTSGDEETEYGVSYQLQNATITFYYSFSKNMDEVVFKRGFVSCPEFTMTFNEEDEDFEERLEKIQDHFNVSFDQIENATQYGYERIKTFIQTEEAKSNEIKKRYNVEESLSFESFFKTIMERHDDRLLSGCCGAPPSSLSDDICSECGEHAEFETEEE